MRFLALLCCCLLCVTGCSKKDDKTVELQLNWKAEPQFGGFYAAAEHGHYAKHGLTVTVKQGGAGAPTIELLGAGKVPFAIVSADEIPKAREQGAKIVALFAVYQTHPQGIMTRDSRGFHALEEIFKSPGTLAMERGLPYSDFLRNKYGFNQLKIVPSPFGDLTQYRTDEKYAMQCFVTSEPLAAEKAGIKPKTFLIADSGFNPYGTVLATSEAYLASNPEQVKAMVAAVSEGWRQYLDDPTQTNAAMAKQNPAMNAATFAASAEAQKPLIETADTETAGLGSMTIARWTELLNQLKDLKVISGEVSETDVNACFRWPLK